VVRRREGKGYRGGKGRRRMEMEWKEREWKESRNTPLHQIMRTPLLEMKIKL